MYDSTLVFVIHKSYANTIHKHGGSKNNNKQTTTMIPILRKYSWLPVRELRDSSEQILKFSL